MNIFKTNKISTLINLQINTDVISQICCEGNTHHVDPIQRYVQVYLYLFIDRITGITWTFKFCINNKDRWLLCRVRVRILL